MRNLVTFLAFALVSLAGAAAAPAHQSSLSYASIELVDDGKVAEYEIRLSTNDLFEALQLEGERDATDSEIRAGARLLSTYVFERVRLRAVGQSCAFDARDARVVVQGERYAQIRGTLRCEQAMERVRLDYQLFFDLDPRHEGLLRVEKKLIQLRQPDATHYEYLTGRGVPSSAWGFLRSGFEHVLYGTDHILFLIALLLVVCLRHDGATIVVRGPSESLRHTAGIVTAFTVAHSTTLIMAALGWIELSSRLVESVIAASIVYVAIENVFRPVPKRRYLVTFSFGLIHGLGFAAMLRPLLPPDEVVLPLLVFNLGVELGQLAVVCLSLPLLLLLLRLISVTRYRKIVLPLAALGLSVVGLLWFAERAFGL